MICANRLLNKKFKCYYNAKSHIFGKKHRLQIFILKKYNFE